MGIWVDALIGCIKMGLLVLSLFVYQVNSYLPGLLLLYLPLLLLLLLLFLFLMVPTAGPLPEACWSCPSFICRACPFVQRNWPLRPIREKTSAGRGNRALTSRQKAASLATSNSMRPALQPASPHQDPVVSRKLRIVTNLGSTRRAIA